MIVLKHNLNISVELSANENYKDKSIEALVYGNRFVNLTPNL